MFIYDEKLDVIKIEGSNKIINSLSILVDYDSYQKSVIMLKAGEEESINNRYRYLGSLRSAITNNKMGYFNFRIEKAFDDKQLAVSMTNYIFEHSSSSIVFNFFYNVLNNHINEAITIARKVTEIESFK